MNVNTYHCPAMVRLKFANNSSGESAERKWPKQSNHCSDNPSEPLEASAVLTLMGKGADSEFRNKLPKDVKDLDDPSEFKRKLRNIDF